MINGCVFLQALHRLNENRTIEPELNWCSAGNGEMDTWAIEFIEERYHEVYSNIPGLSGYPGIPLFS